MKLDPWQRYTPPPQTKKCFMVLRSQWSLGGCMLMPTAFAPLSIVSVKKIYMGGFNAARGPISRDIAKNCVLANIIRIILNIKVTN